MTSSPDISISRPLRDQRFSRLLADAPRIVAESLAPVPDPLLTAVQAGPWAAPPGVVRALARNLLPEEDPCPAPLWLMPGQVRSFRRAVAAVRRFRGALLADPVGSGKTYVALAVAAILSPTRPAACVVPATLVPQWRETAERLGVAVSLVSHERVSRGRLPPGRPRLVLIDEAHRFRNPHTRRYRHLAPWLVGRSTLLVTATPVVNRLADLLYLLLLGIRDDVLLPDGVPSIRALLGRGDCSPALGRLVIERSSDAAQPARRERGSPPTAGEDESALHALQLLERLRLSRSRPIASLVRSVLRHAASSSPAALVGALVRYRSLLEHARDALAVGRPMDRFAIRRFTGESGEQLFLWELLPPADTSMELDLADLDLVNPVLLVARKLAKQPDPKVDRLRELLADDVPSLVFVARRETVRHLRERLGDPRLAWCTGARAGLGTVSVPRPVVLGWFREGPGAVGAERMRVRHLIVTDVAAEGLDLQRAGRVIHYDLPWTPMRLDQREGRAVRLGSRHREVEVVRLTLPRVLEHALRVEDTLRRKRLLPDAAGLGPRGRRLWRWRTELAEALGAGQPVSGVAAVRATPAGVLAGFSLHAPCDGADTRLAFVLLWIDPDGTETESEDVIAARLASAVTAEAGEPDGDRLSTALALLAEPMRKRISAARAHRWAAPASGSAGRSIAARLQEGIREAARCRDASALDRLERALGFVAGGHTAGEEMLLERLAELGPAELTRAAARLPAPAPRWGAVEARMEGVVVFVPG
jgi:superfamily II DNA or RNA helicase